MDAIAQAAGASKAMVHAHHDSKQAVFAATARRECAPMVGRMAIAHDCRHLRSASDLEAALSRIFIDTILSTGITALLGMVIAEAGRFPEIGQIYYQSAPGQTRESVTRYFEQARALGWFGRMAVSSRPASFWACCAARSAGGNAAGCTSRDTRR